MDVKWKDTFQILASSVLSLRIATNVKSSLGTIKSERSEVSSTNISKLSYYVFSNMASNDAVDYWVNPFEFILNMVQKYVYTAPHSVTAINN